MNIWTCENRRILVVDDMESIHEDFREILTPSDIDTTEFDQSDAAIFGGDEVKTSIDSPPVSYEVESAFQGKEGVARVREATEAGTPYQVAFVDMRMPPGWDGLMTIQEMWRVDPNIQVVICTAYSDYSWDQINQKMGNSDRLLILKKPFDNAEVKQLAAALSDKWMLARQAHAKMEELERLIAGRTEELQRSNQELIQMQSQIIQCEKMASIGQLAAGVAHEMNTPVGFVASNFATLQNYMEKFMDLFAQYEGLVQAVENGRKDERLQIMAKIKTLRQAMKFDFVIEDIEELFHDSKEGLDRVTYIIQNLRDFSRIDQTEDLADYNINDAIRTTLTVARNEIKYDADVETVFAEIPAVRCHPDQINQVVLNIVVNAAQAIKSIERAERGHISIQTYEQDHHVVCEIADDGPGIPSKNQSKVFDPFFTTKAPGKGTGLGLSISYDIIVNKHKGQIQVLSNSGEGARFVIKLPINTSVSEH